MKFSIEHIALILASAELVIRLIPTKKDFSMINAVERFMLTFHSILNKIIPNFKKKNDEL